MTSLFFRKDLWTYYPRRETMDINSIQGPNAYLNTQSSPPPVENEQLGEQNREASQSNIDAGTQASRAYEVQLTQEAQDRLAAQRAEQQAQSRQTQPEEPPPPPEQQQPQQVMSAPDASQIVNIVA